MNSKAQTVASSDELIAAMRNNELSQITVRGILTNVPSIRLAPGQVLLGEDKRRFILPRESTVFNSLRTIRFAAFICRPVLMDVGY